LVVPSHSDQTPTAPTPAAQMPTAAAWRWSTPTPRRIELVASHGEYCAGMHVESKSEFKDAVLRSFNCQLGRGRTARPPLLAAYWHAEVSEVCEVILSTSRQLIRIALEGVHELLNRTQASAFCGFNWHIKSCRTVSRDHRAYVSASEIQLPMSGRVPHTGRQRVCLREEHVQVFTHAYTCILLLPSPGG